ncbi:hypothetical protein [Phaeodactylibacter xiamenensis]|uniref:hypothetical protein n=1 Tax=Phaeodactylibacter xiamenensis TaxID=1524460 RepID=UPI0024A7B60A|nr:hypothetical protein [Phaeodactylibacter xiamenensis]
MTKQATAGRKTVIANSKKSLELLRLVIEPYNLKTGPTQFLKHLIFLYTRHLNFYLNKGYRLSEIPPMETNSPALAKELGCSARSVRRYRKIIEKIGGLQQVGTDNGGKPVFVRYRGNYQNYALKISHYLIYFCVKGHSQNRLIDGFSDTPPRTKCPVLHTINPLTNNKQLTAVDNLSTPDKNVSGAPDRFQLQKTDCELNLTANETAGNAMPDEGKELEIPAGVDPADWTNAAIIRAKAVRNESVKVLRQAMFKLYGDRYLKRQTRLQRLQMLDLWYGEKPIPKLPDITGNLTKRINLVSAHWDGPIPPFEEFFDVNNLNGFRSTRDWPAQPERYPMPRKRRMSSTESNVRGVFGISEIIHKNS